MLIEIEKLDCYNSIQYYVDTQWYSDLKSSIEMVFSHTIFSSWNQKAFNEFVQNFNYQKFFLDNNNELLSREGDPSAIKIYEKLYRHRNRCAHNILSYQTNLPSLNELNNSEYQYENYFIWFYTLMGIDLLFMQGYSMYIEALDFSI